MTASQTEILNTSATIAGNIARRMLEADPSQRDLTDHQLACQRIREHGFCPPENLQQPAIVLSAPLSFIDDPEFAEQISASRLEEFCLNFFSIPPAQRAEIWNELDKQLVRMPQLHWRLQTLKEGLEIEYPPDDLGDPATSLARELCKILILPPLASRKAIDELCVKAYKRDKGRELGDALNELHCTLPAITMLRPAAALPDRLRRIRRQAKESRRRRAARENVNTEKAHQHETPTKILRIFLCAAATGIAAIFIVGSLMAPSSNRSHKSPMNDLSPHERAVGTGYTGFAAQFEKDPAKFNGVLSEEAKRKANEFVESVLKQNMNRPIIPPAEQSGEFSTPTLTEFDKTQNGNAGYKNEIIDQSWLDGQRDLFIQKPDIDRRNMPFYKSEFFGDESEEFSRIPQPSAIPSFGTSTPVQKMISQPRTVEEDQTFERIATDALWESADE